MFLQSYDYEIEHRAGGRMAHVDALSRANSILILEENTFEKNLSIAQNCDPEIVRIKNKLFVEEDKNYELYNGLVYRKFKDRSKILFHVPQAMEYKIIFNWHDCLG